MVKTLACIAFRGFCAKLTFSPYILLYSLKMFCGRNSAKGATGLRFSLFLFIKNMEINYRKSIKSINLATTLINLNPYLS